MWVSGLKPVVTGYNTLFGERVSGTRCSSTCIDEIIMASVMADTNLFASDFHQHPVGPPRVSYWSHQHHLFAMQQR